MYNSMQAPGTLRLCSVKLTHSSESNVVVQHTAITLPWNYVKLLSYLLQANVAAREAEDGHISGSPEDYLLPLQRNFQRRLLDV